MGSNSEILTDVYQIFTLDFYVKDKGFECCI